MTRYMIDAIDRGQLSPTVVVPGAGVQPVALVAGYVNGSWDTANQGPTDVTIDVNGSRPDADVLDIETGDATPDAAPGWVRAHNGQSPFPAILYCNRSVRPAVASACAAAGLQVGRDYRWWIATLDGTTALPDMTGVVAVQAWGANFFGGRNIDLSIVYDDAFPKGTPGEEDMPLTIDDLHAICEFVWRNPLPENQGVAILRLMEMDQVLGATAGRVNDVATQVANLVAAVGALQSQQPAPAPVAVDPAALAAALLSNTDAVNKLGDAIAAGLAARVHGS